MGALASAAEAWRQAAAAAGVLGPRGLTLREDHAELLHGSSLRCRGQAVYALLRHPAFPGGAALGILCTGGPPRGFEGEKLSPVEGVRGSAEAPAEGKAAAGTLLVGPLSHANAAALRRALPHTAPSSLSGQAVTIGVGDRLGLAGPGHLRLFQRRGAAPVPAQQSVRELELTGRSYEEVLDASTWAAFQEGYEKPWGADGDHLKTEAWVRRAVGAGFTMITADVSDHIRGEMAAAADGEVRAAYEALEAGYRRRLEGAYLSRVIPLDTGREVRFSPQGLARLALVYGAAVEHTARLYRAAGGAADGAGGSAAGGASAVDFELSVDETDTPTTPEAHAFVALEAQAAGVRLASLAPRFVGEFQKGIDYVGDLEAFAASFAAHAVLARALGHRVSVHSGSDKFRVFPIVGRLSQGRFHLKTSGTSWLVALELLARSDPELYRKLHRRALAGFAAASRHYHVGADPGRVPALEALGDAELPGLFENADARQLLHISYGELLGEAALRERLMAALEARREAYWEALERHIGRHLDSLGVS